jgi:capsule polysaccharide export protein KpsE/RkpR
MAAGSLADLGLGVFVQASENSSALYPTILRSRLISDKILDREYEFSHDGRPMAITLDEYIDADNRDLALCKLETMVGVDTDRRTGFITLSATTKYPELSSAVTGAYLRELNEYNVNHRQSKGGDNERFAASRLSEVKEELTEAEDAMQDLQQANLNYATSADPELQRELSRLQRTITVKEAVFLTLTKSYELSRVEAVKDVPIVQILDQGATPIVKTSPRRSLYMIGSLFGSLFFSILLSLWFELSRKRRFRAQLQRVIATPELRMNRFETKLARRANEWASRESATAPESEHRTK